MAYTVHATSPLKVFCTISLLLILSGVFYVYSGDTTALQFRPTLSAYTKQTSRTGFGDLLYSPRQAIFQEQRNTGVYERNNADSVNPREQRISGLDTPALGVPSARSPNINAWSASAIEANRLREPISSVSAKQSTTLVQVANESFVPDASEALSNVSLCRDPSTSPSVAALPRLSERRGPDDASWQNSMAICACMRDENITDVREWLQYYRFLGVDHIIITDNLSQQPMGDKLQDFVDSGFLTYRQDSTPYAQMNTYKWCLQHYRMKFNWMAFFDADEYLAVRERGVTLKELLNEFKYEAGIQVHWILFGSSGREHRPAEGGVIRHYTTCNPSPNHSSKLIANTYYTAGMIGHPHTAMFWDCKTTVNEVGVPFPLTEKGFPDHVARRPRTRRLALFHYATKSKEDFAIKKARRGGSGRPKGESYFGEVQQNQQKHGLCKALYQLADECCSPRRLNATATQAD